MKKKRKHRPRTVDPIEQLADAMLKNMRAPLIIGLRRLVHVGVRVQFNATLDAMTKRVVAIG